MYITTNYSLTGGSMFSINQIGKVGSNTAIAVVVSQTESKMTKIDLSWRSLINDVETISGRIPGFMRASSVISVKSFVSFDFRISNPILAICIAITTQIVSKNMHILLYFMSKYIFI